VAVVAVAWAGFTGPNRNTTKTVRDPDGDQWFCKKSGYSTCWFATGNPCPDAGGSHPSVSAQQAVCGWQADSCGCKEANRTQTVNLPAATVGGSGYCASPGDNGWCQGGASLELSASEPVSGYVIESIEGNPGGVLCDPADSSSVGCSYSVGGEGNFTIEYWALSSYGDTSEKGSTGMKVDGSPPSVNLSVSGGSPGGGGWYRGGTLDVSVSGADAVSGVSASEVSIDGGGWAPSGQVAGDGVHSVSGRVTDGAGNQATDSSEIRIDGTPPGLSPELSGTKGNNGWYISSVGVFASASDSLSGVSKVEVSDGSGGWQSGTLVISADGTHNPQFRAEDIAGNLSTGSTEIRIDATAPSLSSEFNGTKGNDGWYISPVSVFASASDKLSGVAKVEVSYGSSGWESGPLTISTDGAHNPRFRAEDVAGNVATEDGPTVRIDTHAPESIFVNPPEGSETWVSGVIPLIGQSSDPTSGLKVVEMSFDDGQSWNLLERTGGDWRSSWDSTGMPNETYVILARARDVAGNLESTARVTLRVDNLAPLVDIPDVWLAGESGALTVEERGVGLDGVEVVISNGEDVLLSREYAAGEVPVDVKWDGQKLDGSMAAPGEYPVEVFAWDLLGNRGSDAGRIVVSDTEQESVPLVPIQVAPVQPSDSSPLQAEQTPSTAVSDAESDLVIQAHPWIWPAIAWIGLLSAVGFAKIADPRVKALRSLHDDFSEIRRALNE
jgi:hypothetical protein